MPDDQVAEFVDQRGNRFTLDTSLQVVISGQVGYIEGNAYTFPGRMHIYFPHLGHDLTRSLSEIESMTEPARHWIAGFLAGCVPGPVEYLGIQHVSFDVEPTAEELDRWREFTAEFRRSGYCPPLPARPIRPVPISEQHRRQIRVDAWVPWSYAGQRVWVQPVDTWVEADPQPATDECGFLLDSLCAERDHHDEGGDDEVNDLSAEWDVCRDCGYVEFTPGATFVDLATA